MCGQEPSDRHLQKLHPHGDCDGWLCGSGTTVMAGWGHERVLSLPARPPMDADVHGDASRPDRRRDAHRRRHVPCHLRLAEGRDPDRQHRSHRGDGPPPLVHRRGRSAQLRRRRADLRDEPSPRPLHRIHREDPQGDRSAPALGTLGERGRPPRPRRRPRPLDSPFHLESRTDSRDDQIRGSMPVISIESSHRLAASASSRARPRWIEPCPPAPRSRCASSGRGSRRR